MHVINRQFAIQSSHRVGSVLGRSAHRASYALHVEIERLALIQGRERGIEAMVWKIKEMALMEKVSDASREHEKKETDSLLSLSYRSKERRDPPFDLHSPK